MGIIKRYNEIGSVNEGYGDEKIARFKAAKTLDEVSELIDIYGVNKGALMQIAYDGNTTGVDTAIPQEYWKKVDDTFWFVMDYQSETGAGKLVHLGEKIIGMDTDWLEKFHQAEEETGNVTESVDIQVKTFNDFYKDDTTEE